MRPIRRTVLTAFALLVLTVSTVAVAVPASAQPELEERISLELQEASAQLVLGSFGDILERDAVVDPAIVGTISIELHNVRVETALDAVCDSVGCLWKIEGRRLLMVPDPKFVPQKEKATTDPSKVTPAGLDDPIDISLLDADARQLLASFGRVSGLPVVVDEGIEGNVTIELSNTPARKALDMICERVGCVWEIVEGDAGAVLHFSKGE